MNSASTPSEPFSVVIAGGGVAALEAALALRDLGGERLRTTLIAPNADFVYRPMAVREPFAYSRAQRYPIAEIAADVGAELIVDGFASLNAAERLARTESGADIRYDALLLAVGARPHARFPAAVTVDDARLDELMGGLLEDVDGGYIHQLAFVIPARVAWPLPIYELALMTAARAHEMNVDVEITIATPEDAPLAIFGEGASSGVSALLDQRGITVITSAHCEVPDSRHVAINPGDRNIDADRVIALPELYGPAVRGLLAGAHGFIPVDAHSAVEGAEAVYAAGDATDFELKHGGIAAAQADAAAESIAALAGVPVEPTPFHPVIHGILLTGDAPRYLSARFTGGRGFSSEFTQEPTWSPPTKIAARYLAPYLEALDSRS
jgi:sulfide:quinone oxidoreductase